MLFMHTQQTQPALHISAMHSQQAWIMLQQAVSPLVQVMQTPSLVISHLQMPIIRLQQQTIMPFIITQQLHMPPAIIVQRFCTMVADILSSHVHVIFIPPLHFSSVSLQRGTIIHWGMVGVVGVPPMVPGVIELAPAIPMPARSIKIVLVIVVNPLKRCRLRPRYHAVDYGHGIDYKEAASDFKINYQRFLMYHDHPDHVSQDTTCGEKSIPQAEPVEAADFPYAREKDHWRGNLGVVSKNL
jgi:hypothetical protein